MNTYRVFRQGFNRANNPSAGARPEDCTQHVATVEAQDEEQAIERANERANVTVYNGQAIWARLEQECLREQAEHAASHSGQVLVKYWHGTTPLQGWCTTFEEIEDCLDLHCNSFAPTFEDSEGNELDYEAAVGIIESEAD
jgi:hypothetical protein